VTHSVEAFDSLDVMQTDEIVVPRSCSTFSDVDLDWQRFLDEQERLADRTNEEWFAELVKERDAQLVEDLQVLISAGVPKYAISELR
jgi:hypothetical protein